MALLQIAPRALGKQSIMPCLFITLTCLRGQSCAVPLRCNAVINACATGSCWETALQLLQTADAVDGDGDAGVNAGGSRDAGGNGEKEIEN